MSRQPGTASKINGTIARIQQSTGTNVGNPNDTFHFITPSDVGCPVGAECTPALCAPFELMVGRILSDPNNGLP